MGGCAEEQLQTVEVLAHAEVPAAPPLEAVASEQLDILRDPSPDLAVQPVGLSVERDDRRYVAPAPSDLMTATGYLAPMLVFGPEAGDLLDLVRQEPDRARVVTHPEGTPVDRGLEEGSQGYGDITTRLQFVLDRPLENRWYAIELDLPDGVVGSTRTERGYLARFRPDSHPVVQAVLMSERDGDRVFDVRFSERVEGAQATVDWRIHDGLGVIPCEVVGPEPGRPEHHAVFICSRQETGRVQVDFGGALTTVNDTRVRASDETIVTAVAWEAPRGLEVPPGAVERLVPFDLD
jgi:hypothetical protein